MRYDHEIRKELLFTSEEKLYKIRICIDSFYEVVTENDRSRCMEESMSNVVKQYTLLISCPGDITGEISIINDVIERFNDTFSDVLGISLRTKHWSKNSYPQSGGKPQQLLNEQFVNACDAAIVLFWTRFGTPTDDYGSGTEEEIELMINQGKQVFLYFCDKPTKPSEVDQEGYNKIQSFKEKYTERGIYHTYTDSSKFKEMLFAHLSQYFLSANQIEDSKVQIASKFSLLGVANNRKTSDIALLKPFRIPSKYNMEESKEHIRKLISEINLMVPTNIPEVTKDSPFYGILNATQSVFPKTEIPQSVKEVIIAIAEKMECELSPDFFNLGSLHNTLAASPPDFIAVDGTEEDLRKYELIYNLYDFINETVSWMKASDELSALMYIELVIANIGNNYDEDIEVTIVFPHTSLVTVESFPTISDSSKNYIVNTRGLAVIFGIPATAEFLNYSDSIKSMANKIVRNRPSLPINGNYISGPSFDEELEETFGFRSYMDGENYVLKVRFEYIKQNTSVAFPSKILLFTPVSELNYTISSKYRPDIISGRIEIKADNDE